MALRLTLTDRCWRNGCFRGAEVKTLWLSSFCHNREKWTVQQPLCQDPGWQWHAGKHQPKMRCTAITKRTKPLLLMCNRELWAGPYPALAHICGSHCTEHLSHFDLLLARGFCSSSRFLVWNRPVSGRIVLVWCGLKALVSYFKRPIVMNRRSVSGVIDRLGTHPYHLHQGQESHCRLLSWGK